MNKIKRFLISIMLLGPLFLDLSNIAKGLIRFHSVSEKLTVGHNLNSREQFAALKLNFGSAEVYRNLESVKIIFEDTEKTGTIWKDNDISSSVLSNLTKNTYSGVAMYRDNTKDGILGEFDNTDQYVRLSGTLKYSQNSLTLEPVISPVLKVDDTFFIVLRIKSLPVEGHSFVVGVAEESDIITYGDSIDIESLPVNVSINNEVTVPNSNSSEESTPENLNKPESDNKTQGLDSHSSSSQIPENLIILGINEPKNEQISSSPAQSNSSSTSSSITDNPTSTELTSILGSIPEEDTTSRNTKPSTSSSNTSPTSNISSQLSEALQQSAKNRPNILVEESTKALIAEEIANNPQQDLEILYFDEAANDIKTLDATNLKNLPKETILEILPPVIMLSTKNEDLGQSFSSDISPRLLEALQQNTKNRPNILVEETATKFLIAEELASNSQQNLEILYFDENTNDIMTLDTKKLENLSKEEILAILPSVMMLSTEEEFEQDLLSTINVSPQLLEAINDNFGNMPNVLVGEETTKEFLAKEIANSPNINREIYYFDEAIDEIKVLNMTDFENLTKEEILEALPSIIMVSKEDVEIQKIEHNLISLPFVDIDNHKYAQVIKNLQLTGCIKGRRPGYYEPDGSLNRAEFTKIALCVYEFEILKNNEKTLFRDIESKDVWYAPYLNTAKNSEIIHGYGDGTFRPAQEINFAETLKVVLRMADKQGVNIDRNLLKDSTDGAWYKHYIKLAIKEGIVPHIINPEAHVTRGEMADIAMKVGKRIGNQ